MNQISQEDASAPQQNPVSGSPESTAFKLDASIGAAPGPVSKTPVSTLPANGDHKKIKLWAGVFGGIVIVVVVLVLVFGKTAFYKGQTPPAPPLEDAKIDSEETRSAAAEEPKGETEEVAQETPISVSDTKPVEIALLTPEKETPAAEETATAAKTAEEQAVQESAAAQALASQVENLMQLINQLLEQIKQAIANGNLAEAERLTAQLLQTVQKIQVLAAQAQAQAAKASASAAEASTNTAGAAAAQAQAAATQTGAAAQKAEAAAQEAKAIVAEASDKLTDGTETTTEDGTEITTDKIAEEETVAVDDFITRCIASGGYITNDKQCNVKSVGIYNSLAALQAGLVNYGDCVSVSNYQWLEETQECTKTEYESGDKEKEESIKDGSSKDGGSKIADQISTPDPNAALIQSLLDEIERLRQESRTNQNNSAILARIAELEAALVRLGQQAPPVNVTVTVPAGGAGRAPTECADPSFTYDPVREVCVPPTEVIVRPAASGSGRINRRPGEGGTADEAPASSNEARNDSVSVGAVPPTTQDGTPAATSIAGTTGDRTGIGAAGTTSAVRAGASTEAYGTFIQGGTGPAILLYPVLVGIANGLWYLARRRKNK